MVRASRSQIGKVRGSFPRLATKTSDTYTLNRVGVFFVVCPGLIYNKKMFFEE